MSIAKVSFRAVGNLGIQGGSRTKSPHIQGQKPLVLARIYVFKFPTVCSPMLLLGMHIKIVEQTTFSGYLMPNTSSGTNSTFRILYPDTLFHSALQFKLRNGKFIRSIHGKGYTKKWLPICVLFSSSTLVSFIVFELSFDNLSHFVIYFKPHLHASKEVDMILVAVNERMSVV